jgi:hypothetical protein
MIRRLLSITLLGGFLFACPCPGRNTALIAPAQASVRSDARDELAAQTSAQATTPRGGCCDAH